MSGYDGKIAGLWEEISQKAYEGLKGRELQHQVGEFIPLLANHPCNIFMGDSIPNVTLGNRFDAGEEGVAMYGIDYMRELLAWWKNILGALNLKPGWDPANNVYKSKVSRNIRGNPERLDQVNLDQEG